VSGAHGEAQPDGCGGGDENGRAPCGIPAFWGSLLGAAGFVCSPGPRCACDGDAARREGALPKAGALGIGEPFRAKDRGEGWCLVLKPGGNDGDLEAGSRAVMSGACKTREGLERGGGVEVVKWARTSHQQQSLQLTFGFFLFFFFALAFKLAGLPLWDFKIKGKKKKKKTGLGFIDPTDASGTKLIPAAAPLSIVLHEGSIPFIVLCGLYSIIS